MIGWHLSRVVGYLIGTLYPAYASFKAIESDDKTDDTQWLTYWVVVSFMTLAEYIADVVISWLPFYYEMKILLLFWLMNPSSRGASFLYTQFLRPYLCAHEKGIDANLQRGLSKVKEVMEDTVERGTTILKEKGQELYAEHKDEILHAAMGAIRQGEGSSNKGEEEKDDHEKDK